MNRFAIFVDGSNLYGALKYLGLEIEDYESFFKYIFEESVKTWRSAINSPLIEVAQLRRTYWYAIGSIDEWDLSDPKAQAYLRERFDSDKDLKRKYMSLAGREMPGEAQDKVATEAWVICFKEFQEWYDKKKSILDGMKRFQFAIQSGTNLIEVIECGHWKVDFLHKTLTEKGLDTTLAVDMVALENNYDIALVLSGDADSIPSIKYMKNRNKQVIAIEFIKGYPPERRGKSFSSRIKLAADFVVQIYEMDLVTKGIARRGDSTEIMAEPRSV
jgi:uncharacterized LabA/DUF88 family protein